MEEWVQGERVQVLWDQSQYKGFSKVYMLWTETQKVDGVGERERVWIAFLKNNEIWLQEQI